MNKINFTKMVASGNDFIVSELVNRQVGELKRLAQKICDRKYGVGADGLLVLEKSKIANVKMRIFNPDGSEAEMCGNGARCIAFYTKHQTPNTKHQIFIETKAGVIESCVNGNKVKIKLTEPKGLKLDIPIKVNKRTLYVNFINTGVPHTIIFVEGLDKIDVSVLGYSIRYHKRFAPSGTNVDFVEVLNNNSVKIRTYERGVEDETLACGTGAVAAALVRSHKDTKSPLDFARGKQSQESGKINVLTKSRETLKVYFDKLDNRFSNIWLEGEANIVYKGEYYV
jgi:diaminopimelate epimerase